MQTATTRIWTLVAMLISSDGKHYTIGASFVFIILDTYIYIYYIGHLQEIITIIWMFIYFYLLLTKTFFYHLRATANIYILWFPNNFMFTLASFSKCHLMLNSISDERFWTELIRQEKIKFLREFQLLVFLSLFSRRSLFIL